MARPPTVTETLDHVLDAEPGRRALVGPSGSLTYEALDSAANAAAAALREIGVRPGDRVAATMPNDLDIVVAFHGAMRLGAIWVGLNKNLAPPEREGLLEAAGPTVFIADPDTAALHARRWRVLRADPSEASSEWGVALRASSGARRPGTPDPEAPAAVAFTSGTTGRPKGIVHSQRNLLLPAAALVAARAYDQTLRKGDCLALTILNLQVLTTLVTTAAGGCCYLTDRRDARGVAEWIHEERINVWNGVPALLYSMVHDADLDPALLGSLQETWTGGAACPENLHAAFEARFGVRLYNTYGLTEAPTVVTMEPLGRAHVGGSSGPPLPHVEVVIRDDNGGESSRGETGEIVVRPARQGPWAGEYTPMLGFWRDGTVEPTGSDEVPTGDVGVLDDAGDLFVRDRKKLLIIRGGANVYPAEVERVIESIPGVRSSAVLGVADPRLGQRVVAVVETAAGLEAGPAPTPDSIREHCRARIAGYKVPEQVLLVESLPRNAMGKVRREQLPALFGEGDRAGS